MCGWGWHAEASDDLNQRKHVLALLLLLLQKGAVGW
jgi:hypothetical protein